YFFGGFVFCGGIFWGFGGGGWGLGFCLLGLFFGGVVVGWGVFGVGLGLLGIFWGGVLSVGGGSDENGGGGVCVFLGFE
ncbi:hypothetical protein LXA00_17850, partial [Erwinia amylovora]|uniref:hypothetical protein n=1 Tax=Erwinia amylovora TaxID=552 RepID=UPI0020BFA7FA